MKGLEPEPVEPAVNSKAAKLNLTARRLEILVGPVGFEPTTNGL